MPAPYPAEAIRIAFANTEKANANSRLFVNARLRFSSTGNYCQGANGYIYRNRLIRMHRRHHAANDDGADGGDGAGGDGPGGDAEPNQAYIDADLAHVLSSTT